MVDKIKKEGVISKLSVEDKGYFSLVIILRKLGGGGVSKLIDFRLLSLYSRAWKINFQGPWSLLSISLRSGLCLLLYI